MPHLFKNLIALSIVILLSLFAIYSSNINIPRAIDNGLVLAGEIQYISISPMSIYFKNSWNLPSQLVALFIYFKIPINIIVLFILITPLILNFYGIFLIFNKFIDFNLSFILASIFLYISPFRLIIFDYPLMLLNEHTFGIWAFSLFTLTSGLLFQNIKYWALFFSIISISVHPVVGFFILCTNFTFYICDNYYNKNSIVTKKFLFASLLGSIILIISLYFYFETKISINLIKNLEAFNYFKLNWDTHRNTNLPIRDILINILIIIFLIFSVYKFHNFDRGIIYILYLFFISLFIYILKPFYPDFIKNAMLNKVNIFPSFLPVILLISIYSSKIKSSYSKIFIYTFLLISIFNNLGFLDKYGKAFSASPPIKLLNIYTCLKYKNCNITIYTESNDIKLFNFDNSSLVLTSPSVTRSFFLQFKLPYILDPTSFDFVSYYPETANDVVQILLELYEVVPDSSHLGRGEIFDDQIRFTFENRTLSEWINLSKKFNISYLAVPTDWNISLPILYKNEIFALYIIN